MSAGLWLDVPLTKRACFLCFFYVPFRCQSFVKDNKVHQIHGHFITIWLITDNALKG
jgi:hypothetical protein